jgi:hypothetical protein
MRSLAAGVAMAADQRRTAVEARRLAGVPRIAGFAVRRFKRTRGQCGLGQLTDDFASATH